MNHIEEARKFRKAMQNIAPTLDDAQASTVPQMFDTMKYDGSLIQGGTRINWNGVVMKASVDLWDTKDNTPDNAPILWEDIPYRDGFRVIPKTITATAAFAKDECGWWGEVLYRSKVNNNVYTPDVFPDNWEMV